MHSAAINNEMARKMCEKDLEIPNLRGPSIGTHADVFLYYFTNTLYSWGKKSGLLFVFQYCAVFFPSFWTQSQPMLCPGGLTHRGTHLDVTQCWVHHHLTILRRIGCECRMSLEIFGGHPSWTPVSQTKISEERSKVIVSFKKDGNRIWWHAMPKS